MSEVLTSEISSGLLTVEQMQTLMYTDERRATSASYGFWTTAVDALGQAGPFDPWERLQALQLLTHYAFTNPKHANCSKSAAAATRLCLQLGLQHALPSSVQDGLDPELLRNRKRLFWNSYNIDWYLPLLLHCYIMELLMRWLVRCTLFNVGPSYGQKMSP